jgi:hypothetical protein
VSVVCCQVEVSATSWSLVQRSPTECGVSLMCVIVKRRKMTRPRPTKGCRAIGKKCFSGFLVFFDHTICSHASTREEPDSNLGLKVFMIF